ncbi:MAG: hypothetical protein P4L45_02070 [Ignavibacteriaceae bacterium]|nr:hypothetical protein [Ignavibacteriaceae bacterium]
MNYFKIFILFLLISLTGCKNNIITDPYEEISGNYKSTIFTEPGANDAPVDIQAAGGYLMITLDNSADFTAELYIPTITGYYNEVHNFYKGVYTLKDSLIKFSAVGFFVNELKWDRENDELKSVEVPPRGDAFNIVLHKYFQGLL